MLVLVAELADLVSNGWEGTPPAGDHVVVVSHRPRPEGRHPQASYHFIDDVAQAIAKAKELAGKRSVAVAAGDVGGQALALGLVDKWRWMSKSDLQRERVSPAAGDAMWCSTTIVSGSRFRK